MEIVAVGDLLQFAVEDGEVPTIRAFPPLAVVFASRFSVQANARGNHAPGFLSSLFPRVHVFESPVAIFFFLSKCVGVQAEQGGCRVEVTVSHGVQVLLAVG